MQKGVFFCKAVKKGALVERGFFNDIFARPQDEKILFIKRVKGREQKKWRKNELLPRQNKAQKPKKC